MALAAGAVALRTPATELRQRPALQHRTERRREVCVGGRLTVPAHIMPWGTLQVRPSAQWGQSRGFSQKPAAQRSPWAAVLVPPGRIGTPKPGSTTGRSSGWAACAPGHTESESSQTNIPTSVHDRKRKTARRERRRAGATHRFRWRGRRCRGTCRACHRSQCRRSLRTSRRRWRRGTARA